MLTSTPASRAGRPAHQHPRLVGQHTSIPGWSASTPASQAGRPAHSIAGWSASRPAASTYSNAGPTYHHPRLVGQHTSNKHLILDQHTTIPSWSQHAKHTLCWTSNAGFFSRVVRQPHKLVSLAAGDQSLKTYEAIIPIKTLPNIWLNLIC
ncbi:uncharacterized [Tachysurus ichikawai]